MTPKEMKKTIREINENWKRALTLQDEIRQESIPLLLELAEALQVSKGVSEPAPYSHVFIPMYNCFGCFGFPTHKNNHTCGKCGDSHRCQEEAKKRHPCEG